MTQPAINLKYAAILAAKSVSTHSSCGNLVKIARDRRDGDFFLAISSTNTFCAHAELGSREPVAEGEFRYCSDIVQPLFRYQCSDIVQILFRCMSHVGAWGHSTARHNFADLLLRSNKSGAIDWNCIQRSTKKNKTLPELTSIYFCVILTANVSYQC